MISKRPRVTLIHRYYAPDTPPYASILKAIATMSAQSWPTLVFTANQPYRAGPSNPLKRTEPAVPRLTVQRTSLFQEPPGRLATRACNGAVFALRAAAETLRSGKGTVVMAATTPPIVVGLSASLASKVSGALFIYHNQDVYPEILESYTAGRRPPMRYRALRFLDMVTGKLSVRIVVLSEDMKELWLQRGIAESKIVVLNNFVPTGFHGSDGRPNDGIAELAPAASGAPSAQRGNRSTDTIRVCYIGNLGPLQGMRPVLAGLSATPGVRVEVYGDGRSRQGLEALGLKGVRFHGQIPAAEVPEILRAADLGLVSLRPGVERAAYPSKILSLLAAEVPLLAVIEPSSRLAEEIRHGAIGFVANDSTPGGIEAAIDRFRALSDGDLQAMRERCIQHVRRYSETAALSQWHALFAELLADSDGPR